MKNRSNIRYTYITVKGDLLDGIAGQEAEWSAVSASGGKHDPGAAHAKQLGASEQRRSGRAGQPETLRMEAYCRSTQTG